MQIIVGGTASTLRRYITVALDARTAGLFTRLPCYCTFAVSICGLRKNTIPDSQSPSSKCSIFFFPPIRGTKTHHSQRESSLCKPQLFYFHNTPPQKRLSILVRFHPSPPASTARNRTQCGDGLTPSRVFLGNLCFVTPSHAVRRWAEMSQPGPADTSAS